MKFTFVGFVYCVLYLYRNSDDHVLMLCSLLILLCMRSLNCIFAPCIVSLTCFCIFLNGLRSFNTGLNIVLLPNAFAETLFWSLTYIENEAKIN